MVALRAAIVLPLLAVALFSYSVAGPFHLDDYALLNDPFITSAEGWRRLWRLEQTRPLTWLTFWANYRIAGATPWPWHAVNVLLHGLTVYLVFDVLARLIPRTAAIAAAAIYAIHPIQTEAVAYVYARSSQLAAAFSLLALRSWTRGRHWHAALWFVPALLAKEEYISLPLVFALLHSSISRNRRELAVIGVLLGLSITAGIRLLFAASITPGAGVGPSAGFSPLEYLGSQGTAMLYYLARLSGFPSAFSIQAPDPSGWTDWLGWALVLVLSALAIRNWKGGQAGFWFLAAMLLLLPSSSVFPAADIAADRRLYLPMLGFTAACAMAVGPRLRWRRWLPAGLAVLFSAATLYRIHVWNSEARLWREAVESEPYKLRPRMQLARALPPAEALAVLLEARKFAPQDPSLASELGRTYLLLNQPAAALQEFGSALAIEPSNPQYVLNRGVVLAYMNQREAAIGDFRRALRLKPCMPEAVGNLNKLGEPTPECR